MRQIRTAIVVIFITNFFMTLGFGLWEPIFNNFAVEEIGITAGQMGAIQSIREIPGLLGFLVGILAFFFSEMRIAGISMIVMGFGVLLTGFTRRFGDLTLVTLLMSFGFHFFFSSNASALLMLVKTADGPKALGRMNSLGAVASLISTLAILGLLGTLGYRSLFWGLGLSVMLGGLVLLPFQKQPLHIERNVRRVKLRGRYWLYYALQFLMGSRRHISTTFAIFLLVSHYRVNPQVITTLFLLNNLLATYTNQAFGSIVARFGEKIVLILDYVLIVLIFLSYAFVPYIGALHRPEYQIAALNLGSWKLMPALTLTPALIILLILFVVDRLSMGFNLAVESYFQKIAVSPDEITPNVSLGQAINHIAAVVVPVTGGVLWEIIGPQTTFLSGAAIVLLALLLTLWMRVPYADYRPGPAAQFAEG